MRFGKEIVCEGYTSTGYAKIGSVPLDVQEQDYSTVFDAHGKRSPKTLSVFGKFRFVAAESPDKKGDLILYKDEWYECKSCVEHSNTILKHFHSTFTLDPNGGVYYEF